MTKDELVALAASDWGFSTEKASKFNIETLRKACNSSQGGLNYLKLCLDQLDKGKLTEEDIFE